MTTNPRRSFPPWPGILFALVAIYFALAYTVWSFRHPWATRTEALLCSWSVLTFQAVPYDEMRPREVR